MQSASVRSFDARAHLDLQPLIIRSTMMTPQVRLPITIDLIMSHRQAMVPHLPRVTATPHLLRVTATPHLLRVMATPHPHQAMATPHPSE